MPFDENDEWRRLVQNWRRVWDPWNEVMDRITLVFARGENPEPADLDLMVQLDKELKAAKTQMDEFKHQLWLRFRSTRR